MALLSLAVFLRGSRLVLLIAASGMSVSGQMKNAPSESSGSENGQSRQQLTADLTKTANVADLEILLRRNAKSAELKEHLASERDSLSQELDQQLGPLMNERSVQIATLRLTERLTSATAARLIAEYQPDAATAGAIEMQADRSALLRPPSSELAQEPPPDLARQQRILEKARTVGLNALMRLPNFFATRRTWQYDDGPLRSMGNAWPLNTDLRLVSSDSGVITFRDGREVEDLSSLSAKKGDGHSTTLLPQIPANRGVGEAVGLHSWGEFGAELSTVLTDSLTGSVEFLYWEKTLTGTKAVFGYTVAREHSHYQVSAACGTPHDFHEIPGYHGTLAIDSESGLVQRMTVETELQKKDPMTDVASVIEYGPVQIGNRIFNCPLRSLTFMTVDPNRCFASRGRTISGAKAQNAPLVFHLNRVTFSNYHRLGSLATILPAD